jgi:hypothetical protein
MLSHVVSHLMLSPNVIIPVIILCYHPGDNSSNFYYSWKLDSLPPCIMLSSDVIICCYHLLLSSDVIIWCYDLMLSSDVIIWCYHLMLSSDVIIWCYHLMLSSDVIIRCYHPLLSSAVIIRFYHPLLSPVIPCYHPMLSSPVIISCYHLMLSSQGITDSIFIIPENLIHWIFSAKSTKKSGCWSKPQTIFSSGGQFFKTTRKKMVWSA